MKQKWGAHAIEVSGLTGFVATYAIPPELTLHRFQVPQLFQVACRLHMWYQEDFRLLTIVKHGLDEKQNSSSSETRRARLTCTSQIFLINCRKKKYGGLFENPKCTWVVTMLHGKLFS